MMDTLKGRFYFGYRQEDFSKGEVFLIYLIIIAIPIAKTKNPKLLLIYNLQIESNLEI